MNELLSKIVMNKEIANVFFGKFYNYILFDTFSVLTDSLHKSGFYKQALIIMKLISVVEEDMITSQLSQEMANKDFVLEYLSQTLSERFPNTNKVQIKTFVINMFNNSGDKKEFISTMRDFLICLKEFAGESQDELFKQEQQEAFLDAQRKEELRRQSIPGLAKPEAFEKRNGNLNLDEEEEEDEL